MRSLLAPSGPRYPAMWSQPPKRRFLYATLGILLVSVQVAAEEASDLERWVPALGFYTALNLSHQEDLADSPQRTRVVGDNLKAFVAVQGHLELMTPRLLDSYGQPRLFVRGGAGRSWDSEELSAENKPGNPAEVPLPAGGPPPIEGVIGTGTGVRSIFSPYFYTASAGVAFTIPLEERTLRIKPSVEYRRGSMEIEGIVSHAISIRDNGSCRCSLGKLLSKEQQDHDMLGFGLEAELDAQRAGPMLVSFFASSQAYRVLSGRKLRTAESGFLDDGVTPLSLRTRVFLDEWSFSVGVGMRFRWSPE